MGDVDISVTTAKSAGAMFFGGAGFFLQHLSGEVVVYGSGDFIEQTLGEGERILVSTGNLAVFSGSVKYGVRGVGGCKRRSSVARGFMTELTGPGWVMMQSLKKVPLPRKRS